MTASYTQDTFDRAFVNAIEYLLKEEIVPSKKWFCEKFDLLPQTLSLILVGQRGVPHGKREAITKVMVRELNVRKKFLETNTGIILSDVPIASVKQYGKFSDMINKLEECEKEVTLLRTSLTDKELLIKTQQELIESLKKKN